MPAPLSIVIPTLNAAEGIGGTADTMLAGVTDGLVRELVVSDGGSTDETKAIAKELGAIWVEGPAGRGGQIARGAEAASGKWLLILHADTHLPTGWTDAVRAHMNSRPSHAGYFRLSFRSEGIAPRLVSGGANLRSRLFGLPYGDQGLLLTKTLLRHVGGVPDVPLMEDVELARRLKGRLAPLNATVSTSAVRYARDGWGRRIARNLVTLARYKAGIAPERLVGGYEGRDTTHVDD